MTSVLRLTPLRGRGRFPVAQKADRTVDGIVFDSKKEATRYSGLRLLERAGVISNIETQKPFKVSIEDRHFCTFTVDFAYIEVDSGAVVYEEVKSTGTKKDAAYRLRRKAAELFHGIKITEITL